MFLNLVIAGIVGCLLLVLYAIKGIFDCLTLLEQQVKTLTKATNLLHDRFSRLEIISIVDKEKSKKNKTNDE